MISMRKSHFKLLWLCVAMFVACAAHETASEYENSEEAPLIVRTEINGQSGRSLTAVSGQYLAVDDTIGISAIGADVPTDYAYNNVPYSLDSVNGTDQYWNTKNDIILRRPKATLTAYYPYGSLLNPAAISIDGMEGIDWLYCPWTDGVISARWPDVTLTMKHAQAMLRVELRRQGYAGEGKLKFIKIESNALAMKGVINTSDGSYSVTPATNIIDQQYAEGEELQLPADPTVVCSDEWFFLPTTQTTDVDITFTVKVDKRTLSTTTTISADAFQCGRIHLFPLKVMNSELEVSPVTIIPWETLTDSHPMRPTN